MMFEFDDTLVPPDSLFGTESNSDEKENSRSYIQMFINLHFGNKAVNMFEFLGGGIGVEHYLHNCNIKTLVVCERDKKKYDWWLHNRYAGLAHKFSGKSLILPYQGDMLDIVSKIRQVYGRDGLNFEYDVLNLDFCSYYYDVEAKTTMSTGQIVEKVFENKYLADNSLLMTTFMVGGQQIYASKYRESILTDRDKIVQAITEKASRHGYIVKPDLLVRMYNSTPRTTMMHMIFHIEKQLEL